MENRIIVKGCELDQIKQAIEQWIDLYDEGLTNGLNITLSKDERNNFLIELDNRLDIDRFFYMVNYLKSPEGLDYNIEIQGFTKGSSYSKLNNKELLVYISNKDPEFDNVYVITSDNENYKIDFGGRITSVNEKVYYHPFSIGHTQLITDYKLKKKESVKPSHTNKRDIIAKRFYILSTVIALSFVCVYLVFFDHKNLVLINAIIAFGVWGWLLYDYEVLQIDRLYVGSFMLTLLVFMYCNFFLTQFSSDLSLITISSSMPIFMLIVQRPLRFIFKWILKREPVIGNVNTSFADNIYKFILFLTSALIPALCFS